MQKTLLKPLVLTAALVLTLLPLGAADAKKDAKDAKKDKPAPKPKPAGTQWDAMDLGAFYSGGLQVTGEKGDVFRPALKGLNINLGSDAAVCFDTERLRFGLGWRGGFVKLPTGREGLEGVASPIGEVAFKSEVLPGWADASGGFIEPKDLDQPPQKGTAWIGLDPHRTPVKVVTPTRLGDAVGLLVHRGVELAPAPPSAAP